MTEYPIPDGWWCPKRCSNKMTVTTANGTHHRGSCAICRAPLEGRGYWVPKPDGFDDPPTDTQTASLFDDLPADPHADLKRQVEQHRQFMR